jgi:hypothetical protein
MDKSWSPLASTPSACSVLDAGELLLRKPQNDEGKPVGLMSEICRPHVGDQSNIGHTAPI